MKNRKFYEQFNEQVKRVKISLFIMLNMSKFKLLLLCDNFMFQLKSNFSYLISENGFFKRYQVPKMIWPTSLLDYSIFKKMN